jgi:hypothetical protein
LALIKVVQKFDAYELGVQATLEVIQMLLRYDSVELVLQMLRYKVSVCGEIAPWIASRLNVPAAS